jgi:hypothetical protein
MEAEVEAETWHPCRNRESYTPVEIPLKPSRE